MDAIGFSRAVSLYQLDVNADGLMTRSELEAGAPAMRERAERLRASGDTAGAQHALETAEYMENVVALQDIGTRHHADFNYQYVQEDTFQALRDLQGESIATRRNIIASDTVYGNNDGHVTGSELDRAVAGLDAPKARTIRDAFARHAGRY